MEPMTRNPDAVAKAILEADTVAVCSHICPDGDTLGSALAMRLGLLSLGKKVSVFCDDKVPDNLSFLPGAEEVRKVRESDGPFDLMLAVDVSDAERLGTSRILMEKSRNTAQIDHHPTNPLYMAVNSVDGKAPASCNLIFEQLQTLGVPLTRDMAICLYAGISTDTGNFSFSSTNAETFDVMRQLMEHDLPLSELSRILFREKSREQILLLGKVISSLRYYENGKIAVMKLTRKDFADCGALKEHADTLVNYGLETTGTEMALLGREDEDGQIKFSLRAKSPNRINDIASAFGGGGHPQASGVTLKGTLDETTDRLLNAMIEKIKKQEQA